MTLRKALIVNLETSAVGSSTVSGYPRIDPLSKSHSLLHK